MGSEYRDCGSSTPAVVPPRPPRAIPPLLPGSDTREGWYACAGGGTRDAEGVVAVKVVKASDRDAAEGMRMNDVAASDSNVPTICCVRSNDRPPLAPGSSMAARSMDASW